MWESCRASLTDFRGLEGEKRRRKGKRGEKQQPHYRHNSAPADIDRTCGLVVKLGIAISFRDDLA
jgi:hypothetical protein